MCVRLGALALARYRAGLCNKSASKVSTRGPREDSDCRRNACGWVLPLLGHLGDRQYLQC